MLDLAVCGHLLRVREKNLKLSLYTELYTRRASSCLSPTPMPPLPPPATATCLGLLSPGVLGVLGFFLVRKCKEPPQYDHNPPASPIQCPIPTEERHTTHHLGTMAGTFSIECCFL